MDDNAAAAPGPSPSEWLAFAFVRDAPRMPNGQYLGIETAPVEPWPHQRIVARRLVDGWPLSWMLCDEVGLGKTIEAGLALRALRLSGLLERVLVTVPASLVDQWQREMADKFLLPFARACGGTQPRHAWRLPREREHESASLFEPDLAIVSTGLLTRRERQAELKAAPGWDLVLLDEAHCARRSNPTARAEQPARWTRLYRIVRDVLRPRAAAMWLATATPMQLEPIEAIDLAGLTRRLGPFALEPQVALAWYALLDTLRQGGELAPLEWRFLARAARHALRFDAATAAFVERTMMRGRAGATLRRWLRGAGRSGASPPASVRRAVPRLLFALAPLSRTMMRHNRGLLRKYQEAGRLPKALPRRRVHLPAIRLAPDEQAVYDLFAPYCRALAARIDARGRQRIAVGFMLGFFGLRFASSYKAIHDTLVRRRERVLAALQSRLAGNAAHEADHDGHGADADVERTDGEQGTDADAERAAEEPLHGEDDVPGDEPLGAGLLGRKPADLQWEADQLAALLAKLATLAQRPSSKVRVLLQAVRARRIASGRLRPIVVFTRFYDTLCDLQGWLERKATPLRLGVFSGPRCAWTDASGAWHASNREEIKRRFVRGDIDLLLCTDAAAEGLNLQSADLLVNFDLPWNPMKLEQRIGRIDRIGQRHATVHVMNLAYPGTVEEEVHVRLQRRLRATAATVGAQPFVVLPVQPADLRRLATGELSSQQLEALVRERLKKSRERTESMIPGTATLHALYREIGDELAAQPLPITLEQVFELLAGSAWLKSLRSEIVHTARGDVLRLRGVPGLPPCLLTVSRALFEHGLEGCDEPLRFATWGEPAFDAVIEHALACGEAPPGFARTCAAIDGTKASVVSWVLDTDVGPVVIESFEQLAAVLPAVRPCDARKASVVEAPSATARALRASGDAAVTLAAQRAAERAADRAAAIAALAQVEQSSRLAATAHHRTHRALAVKLLAAAPRGSRLDDLEAYLPDCTRTLRIPRLAPALVAAEAEYGLLETEGDAIYLPAFYQRCLVATLQRERLALRRARRAAGEGAIALAELAQRLARPSG